MMIAAGVCEIVQPSWSTFWRVWHHKWSNVLCFRKSSSHSKCTQCFDYQELLHRGACSLPAKQEAAKNWRSHLREQYHDRMLYWHLRWFSRQTRRQSPVSSVTDHSVLTIIIDSMDKSKLVWPQYSFQKPKILDKLRRPRMVLTAAMAHGWTTEFFLTDDEVLTHGASHFCDMLVKTLERVAAIAEREGREMPRHIVIQSDNTTSQAKNSWVGQFLSTLTASGRFETATLNFLPVGHTHEDVDLLFGILLAIILVRYRVQCPLELAVMIEAGMQEWAQNRGEECHCMVRDSILDFKAWLDAQGIHLHNCWVTRSDIEAPHSFSYKRRHGLMDDELAAVGVHPAGHAHDVFCVVKHRMHSLHPNGPPVLVLPWARYLAMPTTSPSAWEAPKPFDNKRARELRQLADELEKRTDDWGVDFSYFRGALALRTLAAGPGARPLEPCWLDRPSVPAPPVRRDTGNVYFGHLPNMSWRMLVTYR